MYDNDYEGEVIENEFDDSGVVFEKPIELDIFAEDAWDDTALLAAFHESLTLHPESNSTESYKNKRGKIEPEEAPRKRVVRHFMNLNLRNPPFGVVAVVVTSFAIGRSAT